MKYPKGFERPGYVLQLQKTSTASSPPVAIGAIFCILSSFSKVFRRSSFDSCLFSKTHPDGRTHFVLPWVYDILMVGATDLLAPKKSELARYFTITAP
jgi:hypothetical protein